MPTDWAFTNNDTPEADMAIDNWQERVEGWAGDRNLLYGSTAELQMVKLREEVEELSDALFTSDCDAAKDAIGDCAVVLCIQARQLGLSFEDCLEAAWEQIKDRTGRMVDGIFIKDA